MHCLCRGKDEGFMIGCDGCDQWFHGKCVGVSQSTGKRVSTWYCGYCANWQKRYDGLKAQISAIELRLNQVQQENNRTDNLDEDQSHSEQHIKEENDQMRGEILQLRVQVREKEDALSSLLLKYNQVIKEKEESGIFFQDHEQLRNSEIGKLRSQLRGREEACASSMLKYDQVSKEKGEIEKLFQDQEQLSIAVREENEQMKKEILKFKDLEEQHAAGEEIVREKGGAYATLLLKYNQVLKEKENLVTEIKNMKKRKRLSLSQI